MTRKQYLIELVANDIDYHEGALTAAVDVIPLPSEWIVKHSADLVFAKETLKYLEGELC